MNAYQIVAVGIAVGVLFAATPALAGDPDSAEALFARGVAKMEAGQYDEACPEIEASYKLEPLPGALYALADCERKRGRLAVAAARYDEYLALYATLSPDRRAKQGAREKSAREQRAALGPKIAELTVALPQNAPASTLVMRDGAPVPDRSLGVPVPVEPGEHVVTTQTQGGPVTEARVTLAAGDKRVLALEVRLAGGPTSAAPAPPVGTTAGGPNRAVLIAGGAVAGAGVVAGAVLLGVGLSKNTSSLYDTAKASGGCPPASSSMVTGVCASLKSALESRSTLGSAGVWTLVGGGVVGVATGVYALAGGARARAAGLVVSPVVGREGGGLAVGGTF
jgi:hypothetical protein